MKKLVVLLLVVGLASVSFGSLTPVASNFSAVLVGTTLTISSSVGLSAGTNEDVGFYDLSPVTDALSNGQKLGSPFTAGSLAHVTLFSDPTNGYGIEVTAGSTGLESPVWNAQPGAWGSCTWTGISVGTVLDVENVNDAYTSVGSVTVTPEPMTLALLGLGGLFIRRRTA